MKTPFKTFWNWLFPYKNYPSCLAEELAIKTPYTVEQLQPMIDIIKHYFGFEMKSKEAEQTHIVKEKSYKCIVFAMENKFDLYFSASMLYAPPIDPDKVIYNSELTANIKGVTLKFEPDGK